MQIGKNSVVSIHYTLTDPTGTVIDSSQGRDALPYLHGAGNIIPGLENALLGKAKGDNIKVVIQPEQGYGVKNDKLIQRVPKTAFQGVPEVKVGMQFQAQGPQGTQVVRVVDVSGDNVTVDANHPLAGVTLHFDVTVDNVRPATPEEIAHGHVHGPGGHHH